MFLFSAEFKISAESCVAAKDQSLLFTKAAQTGIRAIKCIASNASERVEYRFHSLERCNQRNACRRCKFLRLLYALCDPVASVCIGTGCYILTAEITVKL